MTGILVVSSDEEASQLLCSSIARSGRAARWERGYETARAAAENQPPLVLVADTAVDGYARLIEQLRRDLPWMRVYLMVDPGSEPAEALVPAVSKPFDAAEFAELLGREQELAVLERGRRTLERELEHAERLAAIGRIAASMAHEINNPLAVIHASASYMAEVAQANHDPQLAGCAEDTLLAVERIGSFVQHVCGYARRERPELSDQPVEGALQIALRLVRPRAKDREVEITFEPSFGPRVPHDPPRLAQAVLNLLSNAVDAAADGGGHVQLRVVLGPGEIGIQVDDDGPGVAGEIREQLFEPFATTKPAGQGTGLGLAITRGIVHDHGGRISLVRREQGGTRAEIVLKALDTSQYSVLVLEDDPTLRRTLSAAVRREGFQVECTGTLAQARELLALRRFAVVVTDVSLPDAPDDELLQALRQASAASRLLVVTARTRRLRAADRVLAKPWETDALVGAVRQLSLQFERVA